MGTGSNLTGIYGQQGANQANTRIAQGNIGSNLLSDLAGGFIGYNMSRGAGAPTGVTAGSNFGGGRGGTGPFTGPMTGAGLYNSGTGFGGFR